MDSAFIHSLLTNFWALFLIIVMFGGSIFIHELGHFLAARRRGLKIDRFSIGFGPKLFAWERDGVEYCISLLPLGGYVALPQLADMGVIEGGTEEKAEELPPISYTDKVIVAVMGAIFNLIFAFSLAGVLWITGQPSSEAAESTVVGYVEPVIHLDQDTEVEGPAFAAGLKPGDNILKVDGTSVSDFSDIQHSIFTGSGRDPEGNPMTVLTVERDGEEMDLPVYPKLVEINPVSGERMRIIGYSPAYTLVIGDIRENSPAAQAGLKVGDQILEADGAKMYSRDHFVSYVEEKKDAPIRLTIQREHETLYKVVRAQMVPQTKPLGILNITDGNRKASLKIQPFYPEDTTANLADPTTRAELKIHDIDDPTGFVFGNLNPGETIAKINGKPVSSVAAFIDTMNSQEKSSFSLSLKDGEIDHSLVVLGDAEATLEAPRKAPLIGFELMRRAITVHLNPVDQFAGIVKTTFQVLGSVFSWNSDISIRNLSGPPGIVRVIHMFAQIDIRLVLWFVCLLNINLAILNLLPIPVLDGGHVMFATIAKLRGKALPPGLIMGTQSIFMILLFSMMIYVSFFDVRRWQGDHESEKRYEMESSVYIQPVFRSNGDSN